jgi:hypothetical protein
MCKINLQVFDQHAHHVCVGVDPEQRGMSGDEFRSAMPDEYKTPAIMLFTLLDEHMRPVSSLPLSIKMFFKFKINQK